MIKNYVDLEGNFLGQFENCKPEVECIEVPHPPLHASQKWGGNDWLPLDEKQEAIKKIQQLEASITPRRLREHTRGKDNGWLDAVNAEIERLEIEVLGR